MASLVLRRTAAVARSSWKHIAQTRAMTAAAADAAAGTDKGPIPAKDPFMEMFKNQQRKYRALLHKTEDLEIPSKTDKAGIKAFAEKLTSIRKELGLYPTVENYKDSVQAKADKLKGDCDGTMRDFVSKAHTIGVDRAYQADILAALTVVETKLGRSLLVSGDENGRKLFDAAVAEIKKARGMDKISESELLAKADYETAEKIVKDLQEMNAQEFFDAYAPAK